MSEESPNKLDITELLSKCHTMIAELRVSEKEGKGDKGGKGSGKGKGLGRWKGKGGSGGKGQLDPNAFIAGFKAREYDSGRHTVYCHYPREVVRIPELTEGRMVVFLDGSAVEGQPPKAGVAGIRVKRVGQETESMVDTLVYVAASHGEVQTVADVVGKIGEDVQEVWMVVDAETSQQAAT